MKRIFLAAVMLVGLSACDHDATWDRVCVREVQDGFETYFTTEHHGNVTVKLPHTRARYRCDEYKFVCRPGYRDGKQLPCGPEPR